MLNAVNGLDAVENVLDGIIHRVFAGFNGKALMTHVLQRNDFLCDLLLRQLAARDVMVLAVIRAVDAAVHAVVGKVQRREHDNAVAIKLVLDLVCKLIDFVQNLRVFAGEQNGCLAV